MFCYNVKILCDVYMVYIYSIYLAYIYTHCCMTKKGACVSLTCAWGSTNRD